MDREQNRLGWDYQRYSGTRGYHGNGVHKSDIGRVIRVRANRRPFLHKPVEGSGTQEDFLRREPQWYFGTQGLARRSPSMLRIRVSPSKTPVLVALPQVCRSLWCYQDV